MLTLHNINVTLSKKSSLQRRVLKNLTLNVNEGDFIVIIGGNGAGKSTLLNMVCGFVKPDEGTIMIDHQDVTNQPQNQRCHDVSIVMQDPRVGTMESMSVFDNMALALRRGQPRSLRLFTSKERKKIFQEKLAMLGMGLENRLDEIVAQLSGGQRQALSLIMAIIAPYKILLLDEITAALDPKTAQKVMDIASSIVAKEKKTCIMITHNMDHAIAYGSHLFILHDGRFVHHYDSESKKKLTSMDLASIFHEI